MGGEPKDQDSQMAAQLKRGDTTAIESLYDRYGRLAYGLAFRILNERGAAEDVVQDAFVSVWRNAAGFDAGRGGLRAWLLSIVRNRAIDRLRGTTRTRTEVGLGALPERALRRRLLRRYLAALTWPFDRSRSSGPPARARAP